MRTLTGTKAPSFHISQRLINSELQCTHVFTHICMYFHTYSRAQQIQIHISLYLYWQHSKDQVHFAGCCTVAAAWHIARFGQQAP